MNPPWKTNTLMVLAITLLLTGCATSVVTDYDRDAAFAGYQSWAFAPRDDDAYLSLDAGRIESAVERELATRTMDRVAPAIASLLISYRIEQIERLESYGISYGIGVSHRRFGWGLTTAPPVREAREGKLVIELVDARTERVVWRGASKRYLNENQSPEKRQQLIDEVVAEMFSRYPPEQ